MLTSIKRIRLELGRSQFAVAAQVSIHPTRLSKIELGRERPRTEELERLAAAFGVPVTALAPAEAEAAA